MKKYDERIRSALDARLSSLEASAGRRARIRQSISREEEPYMKRKLTAGLAFALVLALALTGAAVAAGINLFDYFGKFDDRLGSLAPDAVLETQLPETVETADLGETQATIVNGYYDGISLMLAYSIVNGERMELFTEAPTEEQLRGAYAMEKAPIVLPLAANEEQAKIMAQFNEAIESGTPMGFVRYSVFPSDHSEAEGTVDLGPYGEYQEYAENGETYHLREFDSPLPEEIRNLDGIDVQIRLYQNEYRLWFDGEVLYKLSGGRKAAGAMTATVKRTGEGVPYRKYEGAGEYGGVPVRAEADASAVYTLVTVTAEQDAFILPEGEDCWFEIVLVDDAGNTMVGGDIQEETEDTLVFRFDGTGSIPEQLNAYVVAADSVVWDVQAALEGAQPVVLTPAE